MQQKTIVSTLPSCGGGYSYSCKLNSHTRGPCQWQCLSSPLIVQKLRWSQMNSNFVIKCVRRAVRKANRKYPSERRELKQKLRQKEAELSEDGKNRDDGYWRFFKVPVPVDKDPGKDYIGVSDALMEGIARYIKFPVANILPQEAFSVVRKSFDARKCLKEPKFVYTIDMNVKEALRLQPRLWDFISDLSFKPGKLEYISSPSSSLDLIGLLNDDKCTQRKIAPDSSNGTSERSSNKMLITKDIKQSNGYTVTSEPKVVVVGSGPAGLFAGLVLAELGAKVTIVERGQPVEKRGRDIGALVVRRQLKSESNFCFGEGGAGTWSDGKLTTKIGKNSDNVQIREFEKEAAIMGGGNFVVPAQTVPNFLESKLSDVSLPPSSYRLGVKAAPLHQLFPSNITHALKQSLISFEKELPGFITKEALLHGVETRTSAPVKIPRDMTSYESLSMRGLYPIGEGAGYAGGIVSAAVDGLCAGFALARQLNLYKGSLLESILDKSQRDTGNGRY